MQQKFLFLPIFFILIAFSCKKADVFEISYYNCSLPFVDSSNQNPNNAKYRNLIDQLCTKGMVGLSLAVYTPNTGTWLGAAGKADIHNNIPFNPCNITRVGSTVKMFTATTVLKLYEEGKIDLDKKIADYLNGSYIEKIEHAEKATVRQLLQHSSGIYNYIQNPVFQTSSLNDLTKVWQPNELLSYAFNKSAYFEPGTDVRYSNTNYILLGFLIEKIEGKPFYKVFEEKIFQPLQLTSTTFAAENPIPAGIVRGYIDMYSNFNVIESTQFSGWDYYTADGGLISTPYDLNKFFKSLISGEIIQPNTLALMLSFKTPKEPDSEFYNVHYGLGIFKLDTEFGPVYHHSGDAIGYYANMMYVPQYNTFITYASNSNYGKIDELLSSKSSIHNILNSILN